MIKNYFIVAWRNLIKQKHLALINILGLSTGLTCFILFLVYAINEFSFDRFHADKENIYRVYRHLESNGAVNSSAYLPLPLGPAMKRELPGVKNFVRFAETWNGNYIRVDGKVMLMPFTFADQSIFSVFSFPFTYGNPSTALKDMHSVVLTEKTAKLLFSTENAIGKTIEIKVEKEFESFIVSGICKDIPTNSTVTFGILASFERYLNTKSGKMGAEEWQRAGNLTYIQLEPSTNLASNTVQLKNFYKKHHSAENPNSYYGLLKLEAIHTNSANAGEGVSPKNIFILIAIAFGILVIACINFTTLAIGRSAGRAKEIGLRKVVGGTKSGLVLQFLTESVLLSLISGSIAIVAVKTLVPYFNQLAGKEISFSWEQFPELPWLITGLVLFVGLLAGSYPAFVLSSFKPIEVLKKKLALSGSNFFTKSLVTFQFSLSIALMIATLIILQQVNYMRSKNPGFNKENVLVVDAENINTIKVYPLFRQALLQQTEIKGIAGSELAFGEGMGYTSSGFEYEGKHKSVYEYYVDPFYLNVMGMTLLTGRNFIPDLRSDSSSVIINETMMKDFGWTLQNATGKQLKGYADNFTPVVIGVVKDFNFLALNQKVQPQMFQRFAGYHSNRYLIRIQPGDPSAAIFKIEKAWKELVPDLPLKYSFMDEDLDRFYKNEARWGNIIGLAGGISIFLACLGLFGLAALATVNRTKEIGIRKVLGATLIDITQLLSKDFVKLIFVAIIIAVPIAWYFTDMWLRDFAYRIEISWFIFAGTGFLALIVAVATIGVQSIKTAIVNPIKSLRAE